MATADRSTIKSDGKDLSFITIKIVDKDGLMVPDANNKIQFSLEGDGAIVATDNGDPANLVSFASHEREAYHGLALAIIRANKKGTIKLIATANGLQQTVIEIKGN